MSEQMSPFNEAVAFYVPHKMEEFYKQRPWLVFGRLMRIMWLAAGFNINLLLDWKFNSLRKNVRDRAKQADIVVNTLDEADNQSRGSMLISLLLTGSRAIRKRLDQAKMLNDRIPVMLRLTCNLSLLV
ncbi:hypothetical protein EON65_26835 [archaeon]|nr:MAG: hypothetical protein EON65_26835 [archaeon]